MTKINDTFKFWCPIEKAQEPIIDPTTGEEIMRLGGIASTSDQDSDGEFLDPKGFNIKPLIESGMVNWHHQAKGQPATIIGEPSKAEIRPEGLYIETDLYPSSQIACDVWKLAQTLEKDSKTRRLGYSIEGRVLSRKSDDKNSKDYKKINKAIITGVAITHQPKNPKTFANIIKGDIDDDFEKEEEEKYKDSKKVEEAVDTENAAALKKESVDKKIKNQEFTKSDTLVRILEDIPGIEFEKAKSINILIQKIADMKKRKNVTEEDISKAYQALGLDADEPTDIQKGGCSADGGETEKEPIKKANSKKEEPEDSEDEDDEEPDSDEDDEEEGKKMKKGGDNRFDRIEKAIATSHISQTGYMKALGVMVKDVANKANNIMSENENLKEVIKAQDETISALSERIEEFGSEVPGSKSLSAARPVERSFDKSDENEFGVKAEQKKNNFSMSKNPSAVSELLDQATFAKGFDNEFSNACTAFEANHNLPSSIIARMKNEYGVEIVK